MIPLQKCEYCFSQSSLKLMLIVSATVPVLPALCAQPQCWAVLGQQRKLSTRPCPWEVPVWGGSTELDSQPKGFRLDQREVPRVGEQWRENIPENCLGLAWRAEYEESLVWRDGSISSRETACAKVLRLEKAWFYDREGVGTDYGGDWQGQLRLCYKWPWYQAKGLGLHSTARD